MEKRSWKSASCAMALLALTNLSYADVSGDYQTTYSTFRINSNSLYNIDMPLKINVDPGPGTARFFAEQLSIGPYTTYMGLQTDMRMPNGQVGKGAIFSIWNATGAQSGSPGSWCQTFGGEGVGYSCRIPYYWSAGNTYRLRIWQISRNSWAAFIKDLTSGIEVQLGTITIPARYYLQGGISTFTEYYGGTFPSCNSLKLSRVTWGMPVGNNSTLTSNWSSNSIGPGDCASIRTSVGRGPTVHSVGV
jgi:hypothetical protein